MPHFESLPHLDALCPEDMHFGIRQADLLGILRDQLVGEGFVSSDVEPWQVRVEWNRHFGGYYVVVMPKDTILAGKPIDPTART